MFSSKEKLDTPHVMTNFYQNNDQNIIQNNNDDKKLIIDNINKNLRYINFIRMKKKIQNQMIE